MYCRLNTLFKGHYHHPITLRRPNHAVESVNRDVAPPFNAFFLMFKLVEDAYDVHLELFVVKILLGLLF